jgi:hypothetical protein
MKLFTPIAVAAAAISASGAAFADIGREKVTVEFRYDANKSPAANYSSFQRTALRACSTPAPRPLALATHEKSCAEDLMDKLVDRMQRADLASVHDRRTGRAGDVFAAR